MEALLPLSKGGQLGSKPLLRTSSIRTEDPHAHLKLQVGRLKSSIERDRIFARTTSTFASLRAAPAPYAEVVAWLATARSLNPRLLPIPEGLLGGLLPFVSPDIDLRELHLQVRAPLGSLPRETDLTDLDCRQAF